MTQPQVSPESVNRALTDRITSLMNENLNQAAVIIELRSAFDQVSQRLATLEAELALPQAAPEPEDHASD